MLLSPRWGQYLKLVLIALLSICNRATVVITRRNGEKVALSAADELASLLETLHLLRSPKNAQRLLDALAEADARVTPPQTVDQLRRELGLD